jgi:adenine-specific DNA methylase
MPPSSLDAVFTDPQYFGNVQYGELMDFCYVWLRRPVGTGTEGSSRPSSPSPEQLMGASSSIRGFSNEC